MPITSWIDINQLTLPVHNGCATPGTSLPTCTSFFHTIRTSKPSSKQLSTQRRDTFRSIHTAVRLSTPTCYRGNRLTNEIACRLVPATAGEWARSKCECKSSSAILTSMDFLLTLNVGLGNKCHRKPVCIRPCQLRSCQSEINTCALYNRPVNNQTVFECKV